MQLLRYSILSLTLSIWLSGFVSAIQPEIVAEIKSGTSELFWCDNPNPFAANSYSSWFRGNLVVSNDGEIYLYNNGNVLKFEKEDSLSVFYKSTNKNIVDCFIDSSGNIYITSCKRYEKGNLIKYLTHEVIIKKFSAFGEAVLNYSTGRMQYRRSLEYFLKGKWLLDGTFYHSRDSSKFIVYSH